MLRLSSIFLILTSFLFSNKNDVLEELKNKISAAKSVYLELKSLNSGIEINAQVAKGNRYKLIFDERQIYCDSKTIWNYSKLDNQVLISNFETTKSAGIETIFNDYLEKCVAIEYSKKSNSKGENLFKLELQHKETDEIIIIFLDNVNNIKKIELPKFNETWLIKKIILDNEEPKSSFTYTPADSLLIIDLR